VQAQAQATAIHSIDQMLKSPEGKLAA